MLTTIVSALSAGLLAGFVKGFTGFGFALVFVPILSLVVNPKSAVGISVVLGALSDGLVLFQSRKEAPGLALLPMIGLGLLGSALGAYILFSSTLWQSPCSPHPAL